MKRQLLVVFVRRSLTRSSAKRVICSILFFLVFRCNIGWSHWSLLLRWWKIMKLAQCWDIQPMTNRYHGAGRSLWFCDLTIFYHQQRSKKNNLKWLWWGSRLNSYCFEWKWFVEGEQSALTSKLVIVKKSDGEWSRIPERHSYCSKAKSAGKQPGHVPIKVRVRDPQLV